MSGSGRWRVRVMGAVLVAIATALVAVPQPAGATMSGVAAISCVTPLPAHPSALPFSVAPPCGGVATVAAAGVTTVPPAVPYVVAGGGAFAAGADYWDVCLAPGAPSPIGGAAGMAVAGPFPPSGVGPPGGAVIAGPYTLTRVGAVAMSLFGPDPATVAWPAGEFAAMAMPAPLVGTIVAAGVTPAHVCPNPGPALLIDVTLTGVAAL